jgi:single-strand DNA-binding protein
MSVLKLIIVGNLGRDAEIRDVSPDTKVISFSVAHSERYRNRSGVEEERTTWVRCSSFVDANKTGIAQYLKKGTLVYVEGTPSVNTYLNKQTNALQAALELRVITLRLLGSSNRDSSSGATAQPHQEPVQSYSPDSFAAADKSMEPLPPPSSGATATTTPTAELDDDLPF